MTTKEIEELLTKYYEGETSLREEHLLKEFFQGDTVPEHLQDHKQMFGFFTVEAKTEPTPALEETLRNAFKEGRIVSMNTPGRRMMIPLSIAASILLIAGLITVFKLGIFTPSQPYGTITDPQLAYIEARNALMLVSSRLNSGLDQVQQLDAFNTGLKQASHLQRFQTGLKKMEKINQFDYYQPIIINPGRNPE